MKMLMLLMDCRTMHKKDPLYYIIVSMDLNGLELFGNHLLALFFIVSKLLLCAVQGLLRTKAILAYTWFEPSCILSRCKTMVVMAKRSIHYSG